MVFIHSYFIPYFWPIRKLIWLDKNIFHWRVETGFTNDFIMFKYLQGPWIAKFVNCFGPLVISTCHNWEILITCPHRPLRCKKIRTTTTTAFLISNTVVLNPNSHSAALDPQSFASFAPGLFNRSVSVWYSNILCPANR